MNAVYVRILAYTLSTVLTSLLAAVPDWGAVVSDGKLVIDLSTFAGATIAALGLNGAIFAKWGVK